MVKQLMGGLALSLVWGCTPAMGVKDAGIDAGSVSCQGVTGPCLQNAGSTQFEDVRVAEGALTNFIVDTLLVEGRKKTNQTIDIALINGGDIRAGFADPVTFMFSDENARIGKTYQGPLSADDIKGWLPYENDMRVVTLTGAQLKRGLEAGARSMADTVALNFGPDLQGDKGGWFLHVAGLTFEVSCPNTTRLVIGPSTCDFFDPTKPCSEQNTAQANTISKVTVGTAVIYENGAWVGGGDTKTFRAIMPSFLQEGGDGHVAFAEATSVTNIARSEWSFPETLVQVVTAQSPLTLSPPDGRIKVNGVVGNVACNLPLNCLPSRKGQHPNCQHLP